MKPSAKSTPTKEKPWRGVAWIRPVGGLCPKHGTPLGTLTKLCITCHHEQLEAARAGSREWELQKHEKFGMRNWRSE